MDIGIVFALAGAALAIALGGMGSSIGVGNAGKAATALVGESPEAFGQAPLLQALPGSQAIYGFLASILILQQVGLVGGIAKDVTMAQGLSLFFAAIPVGITCLISGIFQGKVSASGIASILSKDPTRGGQGVILSSLVETFAILGLLISIMMITGIKIA